jgi:hypothetical protein
MTSLATYGRGEHFKLPGTPSAWFEAKYPQQAAKYGMPILEDTVPDHEGFFKVVPRAPNADFFAAMLDPDSDHEIIYVPRHLSFYRRQEHSTTYSPIEPEDLTVHLNREFLRCAEEMNRGVDVEPLFTKCRSKAVLKQIIERARVILKVSDQFLDQEGRSINSSSLTPVQCADIFAVQCLRPESGAVLALKDCYAAYRRFAEAQGWRTPPYREFTKSISIAVTKRFGVGLRHDMKTQGERHGWGWIGINYRSGDLLLRV